ncbi:MAG TPA: hypothetical protein VFX59_09395 [Polyangiales bacterium]|nr:hypothetical protein [Polyangiales bacterium]
MERSLYWGRSVLAIALIVGSGCGGKDGGGGVLVDGGGDTPDATVDAGRDAGRDAKVGPITSFTIEPAALALDSMPAQPVQFVARLPNGMPSNVPVSWVVEPKELGSIDANGLFTPSGASGNLKITAKAASITVTVTVAVTVNAVQSGDPDFGTTPDGAGGVGGVGGEGGGSTVSDPGLRAALDAPPSDDTGFTWLYPYDGTVWPRGLPAPLLQWKRGEHAPIAVKIAVSVDDSYRTTLYLGAPKNVTTIDRIPLPQAVWRAAQLSGKTMKLALTFVADEGGLKTYRASKELTFTTAPTDLKGIVYYNSYGTKLAENFGGAKPNNGRFGGATLGIEGGSFDPKLVAGTTTPDESGCRVCHTVSADGTTLIALHSDNMEASVYDLRTGIERVVPTADRGKFGWAGLYPDGSFALGSSGPPGSSGQNVASLNKSELYSVVDGSLATSTGFAAVATQAATPQFSPDGRMVAFNGYQGAGAGGLSGNGRTLFVMDVRKDASGFEFSNAKPVFTAAASSQMPGWPFFLPDNSGVVFELELAAGAGNEHLMTRKGARGELWWADLAGNAQALAKANGTGYLPANASSGHGDDTVLQYEPTVAPIVAGGYAWVVFTSRRLYGNVATRNPYESDAREYDLTPGNSAGPTTKKLWVTAISLPVTAGTDPSSPAFYLPAQELYAGNSRGFWSLDVCKADGETCAGGDECCNGYCAQSGEFSVCGVKPPNTCAAEYDACNVDADCCRTGAPLTCIANHCATQILL